ncbi:hypothetical protein MRBLMA1_000523 [Sphingobium sp. LMA1-1-1.1]|uniref:hypothetical protein n=1 Tax=Sphingobium sp. LMA1-1-1.1 TaxID=3135238 RepID=UPI003437121F
MRGILISFLLIAGCSSEESELLDRAQTESAKRLKDPYSAKFEGVQLCPTKGMVTGSINGKNSYGAYTGAVPFVYDAGRVFMSGEGAGGELLDAIDRCYGNKPGTSRREVEGVGGVTAAE